MGNSTSTEMMGPSLVMRGHKNSVLCVQFSPTDDDLLASGSRDATIKLWSVQLGSYTRILRGHTNAVMSVCFSPTDADALASGAYDNQIRLWSVRTGECVRVITGRTGWVTQGISSVCFSPTDGNLLASGAGDMTIRLWSIAGEHGDVTVSSRSMVGHIDKVKAVCFNPADGDMLASGAHDAQVRLWSVATGECTMILTGHTGSVGVLAFDPSGVTIASGGSDTTIRIWMTATGHCTRTLSGHTDWVMGLSFSPTNLSVLASTGDDNIIWLWSLTTGYPTHTLTGNAKYLNTVQFSPTHGDKIVSGTDMGSLLVWKVKGIDSAVEGTAGAQNSPSLTRNMVARKRNAEARIANTQTKLDKDRTDGDAEVSKLRKLLASLMKRMQKEKDIQADLMSSVTLSVEQAHSATTAFKDRAKYVNALNSSPGGSPSSHPLLSHMSSDSAPPTPLGPEPSTPLTADVRWDKSPLDAPTEDPTAPAAIRGDRYSAEHATPDRINTPYSPTSATPTPVSLPTRGTSHNFGDNLGAATAQQLTADDAYVRAERRGEQVARSVKAKVLRHQSSLNRKLEDMAVDRAKLTTALSKARLALYTVNQEINEFTKDVASNGFDHLDAHGVYEMLSLLRIPVSLPTLQSSRITGMALRDVTDLELETTFGVKCLGDRLRLKAWLRPEHTQNRRESCFRFVTEPSESDGTTQTWGVNRTARWIGDQEHLPFPGLEGAFRTQKIDGSCLLELQEAELELLGVHTHAGHVAIITEIKKLVQAHGRRSAIRSEIRGRIPTPVKVTPAP